MNLFIIWAIFNVFFTIIYFIINWKNIKNWTKSKKYISYMLQIVNVILVIVAVIMFMLRQSIDLAILFNIIALLFNIFLLICDNLRIYTLVRQIILWISVKLIFWWKLWKFVLILFNVGSGFAFYLYFIKSWSLSQTSNSLQNFLFIITVFIIWICINTSYIIWNWKKIKHVWHKNLLNKLTFIFVILMFLHLIITYVYAFWSNLEVDNSMYFNIYKWVNINRGSVLRNILIIIIYQVLVMLVIKSINLLINRNSPFNFTIKINSLFLLIFSLFFLFPLIYKLTSSVYEEIINNKYCLENRCIKNTAYSKNNLQKYLNIIPKDKNISKINFINNEINIYISELDSKQIKEVDKSLKLYNLKNQQDNLKYKEIVKYNKNDKEVKDIELYNKKNIFKLDNNNSTIYKEDITSFQNLFSNFNKKFYIIDNNKTEICIPLDDSKTKTIFELIKNSKEIKTYTKNQSTCYLKLRNQQYKLTGFEVNQMFKNILFYIDKLSFHYFLKWETIPVIILIFKIVWICWNLRNYCLNKKEKLKKIFNKDELNIFGDKIFYYLLSPKGSGKTTLMSKQRNIKIFSVSELLQSTQNSKSITQILDEKIKEYTIIDWFLVKALLKESSYKSEETFEFLKNEVIIFEDMEKLLGENDKIQNLSFGRCEEFFAYLKRINDYFINREDSPVIILTSADTSWNQLNLEKRPWLKDMLNDISLDFVDFKWKIYQKNIDNFVIENCISISLYAIFDQEEHLDKLNTNEKAYNQNLRSLKTINNKCSDKNTLFQYVDEICDKTENRSSKFNIYNFSPIFTSYWNEFKLKRNLNLTFNDRIKLHFTFKKIFILLYKKIGDFPVSDKNSNFIFQLSELKKIVMYFNNRILLKYIDSNEVSEELSSEELIYRYVLKLFWENEIISEHVELLEKVNIKVKSQKEDIFNRYVELMNENNPDYSTNSWINHFCKIDLKEHYDIWEGYEKYYFNMDIEDKQHDTSKKYFEKWDKKNKYPYYLLEDEFLKSELLLKRKIRRFVKYEYITIHCDSKTLEQIKSCGKNVFISTKEDKKIKRCWTYNELIQIFNNKEDFITQDIKIKKIYRHKKNSCKGYLNSRILELSLVSTTKK